MPLKAWLGWKELAAAVLGVVAAAALSLSLARAIEHEQDKVSFLKHEIAKLDKEIAEVANLREIIQALLARKQIVDVVQSDRFTSTRLLEELARQRPQGVYFSAVREEGARVFVTGFAASEREANALMANLDASPLLERAQLLELRHESAPRRAGYPTKFGVSLALKGRRALARSGPPRFPSDVHPGDPK